jgi:RNase P subunit RPR2
MQMQRHDTATCLDCRARLWFGLAAETNGWTVYYECDECGFEERAGRISMAEVSGPDEAHCRAEAMGGKF